MKYNISKATAPAMPTLGKGTECIKLLLTQTSKDMHEPLVPMFFPILGAHISGAEFQYPDNKWLEMCGLMANLVADSGCNKGQLSNLVEAICHDFSEHDDLELKKLVEWQRLKTTRYQPNTTPYQAKPHAYQPDKTTTGMFIKRMLSLKYVTHVAICYLFLKAREKW